MHRSGDVEILFVTGVSTFGRDDVGTGGTLTFDSTIHHLSQRFRVGLVCGSSVRPRDCNNTLSSLHWLGEARLKYLGIGTYWAKYLRFRWWLRKLIQHESPDLVVAQGQIIPASIREASLADVPSLAIVRGFENVSLYEPVKGKLPTYVDYGSGPFKRMMKLIRDVTLFPAVQLYLGENKRALTMADTVVANSIFMADMLKQTLGVSPEVIYPHVKCRATPREDTTDIGFITPKVHKGSRIVHGLAEQCPDLDFRCYGVPDSATKAMDWPGNVSFRGWVEQPERIFSEIGILIVPSQWPEPFGRVAAEALQSGVPCIASNVGGLPEIVGEFGWLVDQYQQVCAWEEALAEVFEDEEHRIRNVRMGRRRGWEEFSPEVLLPQWEEMVERTAGKG